MQFSFQIIIILLCIVTNFHQASLRLSAQSDHIFNIAMVWGHFLPEIKNRKTEADFNTMQLAFERGAYDDELADQLSLLRETFVVDDFAFMFNSQQICQADADMSPATLDVEKATLEFKAACLQLRKEQTIYKDCVAELLSATARSHKELVQQQSQYAKQVSAAAASMLHHQFPTLCMEKVTPDGVTQGVLQVLQKAADHFMVPLTNLAVICCSNLTYLGRSLSNVPFFKDFSKAYMLYVFQTAKS
jgi:hypothetical protein